VSALVSAANGAVAGQWEYDPFLGLIRATGPLAFVNPFLGSTKYYDWETGFYYYGYRFYDPSMGRWPNQDPIGELGGRNLYGFVGNNPVNRWDYLGLRWVFAGPPIGTIWIDDPPPPPPQYPQGFSLCQRDLAKDGNCDCVTGIGNALGGEHSYLQYVDSEGNKWGYGWAGAPTGVPESHFNPNSCKPCKANSNPLKYGSGAGKAANSASTAEIEDCIKNNPPTKPYSKFGYNCRSWAKEAAKNCGLDCN